LHEVIRGNRVHRVALAQRRWRPVSGDGVPLGRLVLASALVGLEVFDLSQKLALSFL
jgi:hypothetical protein